MFSIKKSCAHILSGVGLPSSLATLARDEIFCARNAKLGQIGDFRKFTTQKCNKMGIFENLQCKKSIKRGLFEKKNFNTPLPRRFCMHTWDVLCLHFALFLYWKHFSRKIQIFFSQFRDTWKVREIGSPNQEQHIAILSEKIGWYLIHKRHSWKVMNFSQSPKCKMPLHCTMCYWVTSWQM